MRSHLPGSIENGLLRTLTVGWLPWEHFRCDTNCKTDPENCISQTLKGFQVALNPLLITSADDILTSKI
ncbi:hypothetical protein Y1Q_0008184 [Alligator mississippiensis]|uniref:Uncharacterized protein n=1 Tax=Alligator mississippiensis TaxID=8496 RepID=A0A151N1J8_ALLMI|nr:hypothetical protein Y1Q_0008184 [Alligator mississippiensis]